MIQSYSDTSYGGIIAGHLFRLPLSKLGMFPMPKSLPMPHAEQLFDENGTLVAETEWARIIDRFVPWSLVELVRYASALAPLRPPRPSTCGTYSTCEGDRLIVDQPAWDDGALVIIGWSA